MTIKHLTVTQAAEQLGITRQAVLKAINAGHIKAEWFGNAWAIEPEEIDRYKDRERLKPGPKPKA